MTDLAINPLENLEAAIRLLASSRDLDEVRKIRDMAEAARLYAIAIDRGLEAQNHAAEIKIRAERRAGELLAEMPKSTGGNPLLAERGSEATLGELGIGYVQSHRWQQMARVPEERFEAHVEQVRAAGGELSSAGVYNMGRQPRPMPPQRPAEHAPLHTYMVGATPSTVVSLILQVCFPDAQTVLDPTYGNGQFWDGSWPGEVTGTDREPTRALDLVVDYTSMPQWQDGEFDVVTFDPPHNEDAEGGLMGARFGVADEETIKRGAAECWRVCRLGMIAKVTDQVHGGVYVMESDWISDGIDWHAPYQVVHQVNLGAKMKGWNWTEQYSAYNNGSIYLVFRKGDQKHQARSPAQA